MKISEINLPLLTYAKVEANTQINRIVKFIYHLQRCTKREDVLKLFCLMVISIIAVIQIIKILIEILNNFLP